MGYAGTLKARSRSRPVSHGRWPCRSLPDGFYTDLNAPTGERPRSRGSGVHFSTFDARGIGKDLRRRISRRRAGHVCRDLSSIDTDATADVLTSLAPTWAGTTFFNYNTSRAAREALARDIHVLRHRVPTHQSVRRFVSTPPGQRDAPGCQGPRPQGLRRVGVRRGDGPFRDGSDGCHAACRDRVTARGAAGRRAQPADWRSRDPAHRCGGPIRHRGSAECRRAGPPRPARQH
jgi:hypothetical protein